MNEVYREASARARGALEQGAGALDRLIANPSSDQLPPWYLSELRRIKCKLSRASYDCQQMIDEVTLVTV